MISNSSIDHKTTLLTPNRRLAASLLKQEQQTQIQANKTCWQSLDILPFSAWLERLWLQYTAKELTQTPLLLNPTQEQLIWENILRASPANEYLLQISETAELARTAWGILKQWRVYLDHPALKTTEDGSTFQEWANTFQALCDKSHWLDSNSLADILAQKIQAHDIQLPERILLAGFTEISPLYQHLLLICEKQGCTVEHYTPSSRNQSIQRLSLENEEAELNTMARWAKVLYDKSPDTRIACVIPSLEKCRERVIQSFSAVFSKSDIFSLDYSELPFNISAGKTLSSYPVIHTALRLLKLRKDAIPLEVFSSFLRSPFIGEAEKEMLQRAQFDNQLRKANCSTVSLPKLLQNNHLNLTAHCPALANRFESYLKDPTPTQHTNRISQWVTQFVRQLGLLGWPGERSLNSYEYQVVESWLNLLNEFASYETVLGVLPRQRALEYLLHMSGNKVFQPQSPEAPIQILGPLEALEMPFDHIWIMGLDDSTWPSAPKPNPFIPQRLQKLMQMPHATAEKELTYCLKQTQQLSQFSPYVIFSHSRVKEDTELRPSPLIKDIPEMTLEKLDLAEFISPMRRIFDTRQTELIQDDQAPAITEGEKIRGGASVFKLQAACPFKAFAELRLHAKIAEAPTLGLRPQERGNIVHKVLEKLWRELKDQHTLMTKDPDELKDLIKRCIREALTVATSDTMNNTRYRELESQRIEKIIWDWLELEMQRDDFKVLAIEQERVTRISGMDITLRIDRVDEVATGKKIIIDYKTGSKSEVKSWFGARPDEPQLPLYCITDPEHTVGLLFAQVNTEEMKWEGVSELGLGISSVKHLSKVKYTDAATWLEQINQWRTTLEKLGDDFYQGRAVVDPKNLLDTCLHCDLQSFCRVNESL